MADTQIVRVDSLLSAIILRQQGCTIAFSTFTRRNGSVHPHPELALPPLCSSALARLLRQTRSVGLTDEQLRGMATKQLHDSAQETMKVWCKVQAANPGGRIILATRNPEDLARLLRYDQSSVICVQCMSPLDTHPEEDFHVHDQD